MNYYNHFKTLLDGDAKTALGSNDKGYSDYSIDVALDGYLREITTLVDRETLTTKQGVGYTYRLTTRACVLKEKNYKAIEKRRANK